MAYIALENLLDKSNGSLYKLVVMAARRALEVAEGHPKLTSITASAKPSTIALDEIRNAKVYLRKTDK
ncbi:MAG: DNA-directed RNA polymerase subunit omega [Candidatus Omnitrophica bacterium]|nr:DNA-directed RNA polymerase subunit omega [Candidatus Omnitrophota bacterium]